MIDLGPATDRMAAIVLAIPDDALAAPTPCAESSVGDLVDHVGMFARVFQRVATKSIGQEEGPPPAPDASNLADDWRTEISASLTALADAWRDPAAWSGMTRAGGLDLPGEVAGIVALDELVVHGWDLATATGQEYDVDDATVAACRGFVDQVAGASRQQVRGGLFGPVVDVADSASPLDRLLGATGRDPGWSPG